MRRRDRERTSNKDRKRTTKKFTSSRAVEFGSGVLTGNADKPS